jgi:hypothetical protein
VLRESPPGLASWRALNPKHKTALPCGPVPRGILRDSLLSNHRDLNHSIEADASISSELDQRDPDAKRDQTADIHGDPEQLNLGLIRLAIARRTFVNWPRSTRSALMLRRLLGNLGKRI